MIIQSSKDLIMQSIHLRVGEKKLGEVLNSLDEIKDLSNLDLVLKNTSAQFIILGVSEDIGVRANHGNSGTQNAYSTFLKYFVNTQYNQYIDLDNFLILGELYVKDLMIKSNQFSEVSELRKICSEVDGRLSPVIELIVKNGKTPIVIGGGHNNSYGNIKGVSQALGHKIDVLNIDPHADFRSCEGRHSGNGFSYAYANKYLSHYAVWGLHKEYNNESILYLFEELPTLFYQSFDEINLSSEDLLPGFLSIFGDDLGVEVDLDSIKNMPCSARSPLGFTEEDVLRYLAQINHSKNILYYHLCEGSPDEVNQVQVGKFLSYVVRQIIQLSIPRDIDLPNNLSDNQEYSISDFLNIDL